MNLENNKQLKKEYLIGFTHEACLGGDLRDLLAIFRSCRNQLSIEREEEVALAIKETLGKYPDVAVMVSQSLAFGVSEQDSDIDLRVLTFDKNRRAIKCLDQEIASRLPGVVVQFKEGHAGDLSELGLLFNDLKVHPVMQVDDLSHQAKFLLRKTIEARREGGLVFGLDLNSIWRQSINEVEFSDSLKKWLEKEEEGARLLWWQVFRICQHQRYVSRLIFSQEFQKLEAQEAATLLAAIKDEVKNKNLIFGLQ